MFPVHVNLGFNTFYFYEGLYFALAMALGAVMGFKALKREKLIKIDFYNLAFTVLLSAVIVGRISHFVFWNYKLLFSEPWQLLFFWQGGISITGGLVGGFFGGFLFTKKYKLDFWHHFAVLSPGILIAQAAGRIGCFLNGDAFGTGTTLPWGIRFPRYGTKIPPFQTETSMNSPAWLYSVRQGLEGFTETHSAPLHPTQIYEALGDVILVVIILLVFRLIKKSENRDFRSIFFIHSGGYSLLRWGMEFIRADREGIAFWNMSGLQVTLLAYALFSAVMLVLIKLKPKKGL